jgi:hypothetical protein
MRAHLTSLAACFVAIGLISAGCGSDPAAPETNNGVKSNVGQGAGGSEGTPAGGGGSSNGGAGGVIDPGGGGGQTAAPAYPPGPYGQEIGSVLQDYVFFGLHNPKEANYDVAGLGANIALHDFYNPEKDAARPQFLLVTASARWCPHCKNEAKVSMAAHDYWAPKGVQFMTAIFEDDASPPNPAVINDLVIWTKAYKLEYPTVLDPSLLLGKFFTVSAAPFNMIVDLSDMTIKWRNEGEVDLLKAGNPLEMVVGN